MAYTLNSIDLGVVVSENYEFDAGLEITGIPLLNSSQGTYALPLMPKTTKISIHGIIKGNSNITSFVSAMLNLIDTDTAQTTTLNFTSDTFGTISVKVERFSYSLTAEGTKEKLEYDLTMVKTSV